MKFSLERTADRCTERLKDERKNFWRAFPVSGRSLAVSLPPRSTASRDSTRRPTWPLTPECYPLPTPAAGECLTVAYCGNATNGCAGRSLKASWSAVQFSGYFGALYRCARARGKNKNVAITMVAHRMVKIIWLLLSEQRPYTETLPDRSADGMTVVVRRKASALAS